jgi:Domain of unknown function (DUF5710)
MSRIELRVSFEDNEIVKKLGAHWDPNRKVWFVPRGVDPGLFGEWIGAPPEINVRSPAYLLARSESQCPRCGKFSAVHGFILPEGHETLYIGDEEDEDEWEPSDEPTLLSHITYLSFSVAMYVRDVTPFYRLALDRTVGEFFYTNFCEHCNARFDDHGLFSEPGDGFVAFTLEDAQRVHLQPVIKPFAAECGGFSIGVALYEDMTLLDPIVGP